ncbi:MAG TPA: NAD(P)/FAD-dependent oxidoreductase [Solirubrobacterales bacterium]|jgi:cation diffusion facilitator CzcD-associated flavoprotein CzcO|nr:NAD(P)/FAD-dependent oxidoreductase [Solirubrobacterales bacterium]
MSQEREHVNVLIIGAGLSGIGAGVHLQRNCPGKSYAILESREAIGGTWDLFRYPGIRSDSDMYTLGYSFKPWNDQDSIAAGEKIRDYIRETACEYRVEDKIRFGHKVVSAEWSSAEALWTVRAEHEGGTVELTCDFFYGCTGYYRYDEGFTPEFPGRERFGGRIVHPQHWPEDLDYAGKRVVVIGSGATAVTLIPAMAPEVEQITMLQRSPGYVVTLPAQDPIAKVLRRFLPDKVRYGIVRWKNVLTQMAFYQLSRRAPGFTRKLIRRGVERQLPQGYDVDRDFEPKYNPWDERVCLVPGGDLFTALRSGKADVVTDTIETFTEKGIELTSGRELEADVIVTATGLNLLVFGGIEVKVDGERKQFKDLVGYKGAMFGGVPNMAIALGYTNASFTLKCDLVSQYVCRLLNYMDAHGYRVAMPRDPGAALARESFIDLKSGYVLRAMDQLPQQGDRHPWRLHQNYAKDIRLFNHGPMDEEMEFSRGPAAAAVDEQSDGVAAVA